MSASKRNPESWLSQTPAELYADNEYITLPPVSSLLNAAAPHPSADLSKQELRVLDIGCGMGQVAMKLTEHPAFRSASLCNIDKDESMVEVVTKRAWSVEKVDILNEYTHVFANFVFFLLSDPAEGLARAVTALVPGGILAFTTWARSGPFLLLQEAFSLLPSVPQLPSTPVTWNDPDYVGKQLSAVPVEDITVDKMSYAHNIEGKSLGDLAWDMRPVVAMIVRRWPAHLQTEYGWAVFGKIEEVLRKWESEGRELESDVWVFTARKKGVTQG